MTLILSNLCRSFVSQVSDRLVSRKQADYSPAPFDSLANKTIIYGARDAIVSMSYTGSAYIGSLSTDDWIVQNLTDVDVTGKFGMRGGPLPTWYDIGQATRFLLQELSRSEVAKSGLNFELVIVGWQWRNRRRRLEGRYLPMPMAWGISKPQGGPLETKVERLPRHWQWPNRTFFNASPSNNLPINVRDQMFERLRKEEANNPRPQTGLELADRFENAAVDSIRSVSLSPNRYVGPNCMSVVIAPPHQSALVRVTFFPFEQHRGQLAGKSIVSSIAGSAMYSPWVVGQGNMRKPSIHMGKGDFDISMGGFMVKLVGMTNGSDNGVLFAMSSQQRPPRPQR
jgi:hypothetical protein